MYRNQNGFTLIELMIVVAIIGILAAIALPAYQDYTKRAHVSEGLTLAGAAKTGIVEYYNSEAALPTTNSQAGMAPAGQITGNAVKSIEITSGFITVTYNAKVSDDDTIILSMITTAGGVKFTCNRGTIAGKYRPSACR